MLRLLLDQHLPSAVRPARLVPHVFVCCGSSRTGDLLSAVWPAGLVPHVFVCYDSSLTSDLPSAVWPAGLVLHAHMKSGSQTKDHGHQSGSETSTQANGQLLYA